MFNSGRNTQNLNPNHMQPGGLFDMLNQIEDPDEQTVSMAQQQLASAINQHLDSLTGAELRVMVSGVKLSADTLKRIREDVMATVRSLCEISLTEGFVLKEKYRNMVTNDMGNFIFKIEDPQRRNYATVGDLMTTNQICISVDPDDYTINEITMPVFTPNKHAGDKHNFAIIRVGEDDDKDEMFLYDAQGHAFEFDLFKDLPDLLREAGLITPVTPSIEQKKLTKNQKKNQKKREKKREKQKAAEAERQKELEAAQKAKKKFQDKFVKYFLKRKEMLLKNIRDEKEKIAKDHSDLKAAQYAERLKTQEAKFGSERQELNSKINSQKSLIEDLQKQINILKMHELRYKNTIHGLRVQNNAQTERRDTIRRELQGKYEEQLQNMNEKNNTLARKQAQLENKLNEKEKSLNNATELLNVKEEELKNQQTRIDQIEGEKEQLKKVEQGWGQRVKEEQKQNNELRQTINKQQETIDEQRKTIDTQQARINVVNNQANQLVKCNQNLVNCIQNDKALIKVLKAHNNKLINEINEGEISNNSFPVSQMSIQGSSDDDNAMGDDNINNINTNEIIDDGNNINNINNNIINTNKNINGNNIINTNDNYVPNDNYAIENNNININTGDESYINRDVVQKDGAWWLAHRQHLSNGGGRSYDDAQVSLIHQYEKLLGKSDALNPYC